jgi:O-antigen/teichoic acid export membrane protein
MATFETSKSLLVHRMVPWLTGAAWEQVKEYAPTFLTEFVVMASQILLYKFAAHYLGKTGFSEYALARRTVSLLFPIPILGLAVGLPRYIGFTNGRGDNAGAARYYGATLWCVAGAAFICLLLMNSFAKPFAYLFFGDNAYSYLALPLSLMILGQCIHTVVCGYFRGHMALNRANVLQFVNSAIVPIAAFLAFGHSLTRVLMAIGAITTLTASASLFLTPLQAVTTNNWKEFNELLRYGVQRIPGDFILVALFTLPATFLAHLKGIEVAGFVAFGVSVVSMIGAAFAPVGLVLLPKATFMLAEGSSQELRKHLKFILQVTACASLVIALGIWIWIPGFIRLYLGAGFEQVVPIARVLIFAALPYSLYLVLRNLVDAYHEYGATAGILACGLAIFLVGSFANRVLAGRTSSILIAFVVAHVAIATISGFECLRILRKTS